MPQSVSHHHADARALLGAIRNSPGLRRLLAVRLTSQITDGIFQAALFGAILFNPERHADPLAVAGGLAVLLIPYSVIGPFAGALLDHWDRRSVLVFANILRAALIGVVALCISASSPDTVVLISALLVTGASRFVASGLSAGLPHVAAREVIVGINAIFTTLGAAMLGVGAGIVVGLRLIFGSDDDGSALTSLAGVVTALIAAAIARGFARLQLGPDHPDEPGTSAPHAVAVGLWHGFRAVAHSRPVAAALSAIGMHRLVFGLNTLMVLMLSRNIGSLSGGGGGEGLALVSVIGIATAAGALLAAIVTPISVDRWGRRTTLLVALSGGLLAELSLLTFHLVAFIAAASVLGLIGQMAKLCGDVAMQVDIEDSVRGQVFSVQDAIFNIAYVCAVSLAAFVIAPDGHSPALPILGAVLYIVGLVAVRLLHDPRHHSGTGAYPTVTPARADPVDPHPVGPLA